jgi:hypothetical protein
MFICLASVKGGVGVTTFAVALALRWPPEDLPPLLVELDPAGGDLAARWQTHEQPGLIDMVLAARRGPLGDGSEWAQPLALNTGRNKRRWPQVHAVVAPAADGAAAAMAEFIVAGPAVLRDVGFARTVLADVGRLDPHSPMRPFLARADQLLLLIRPTLDQLHHLQARLPELLQACPSIKVVLAGRGPYAAGEISAHLGVPVIAEIPADLAGAAVLSGAAKATMGWSRRPLMIAARTTAVACLQAQEPARDITPAHDIVEVTS